MPTEVEAGPSGILTALRRTVEGMACSAGLPYPAPGGCGIGLPGVVDYRSGRVMFSGPLGWREPVEFGAMAQQLLDSEVAVDTDVNAGALADLYFGAARESSDMLYISWGTGIGGGFACGRRLYHSRGNAMCNLGHMPADPESRRICYCGASGCLEVEAGGRAMVQQAAERLEAGAPSSLRPDDLTPERIAQAAASGDKLAGELLTRSAVLIARVLAGLLAFLNPDTVVFGGGVSRCFSQIEPVFNDELKRRTPVFSLPWTRVVQSQFGAQAGVLGAAMLPRNRAGRD